MIRGGHVYGVDYDGAMCLDVATGEKLWETTDATSYSDEPVHWATGFITPLGEGGDRYLVANDHGDLILCTLRPEGYKQISRTHVIDPTNKDARRARRVWSHPAYANRSIYWRNDKELVCASLATPNQ